MQAEETIDVESIKTRVRGACFISGCPCKDARIVSYRRAGFFAFLARGAGQTAGRFVPVEAEWRLPMTPWTDLQSTTISDPLLGLDDREDLHQAPTSIHSGIER